MKTVLAAIEIMIWQAVTTGALPAAALASELERYARLIGDDAGRLQTLASMARAAARPSPVPANDDLPPDRLQGDPPTSRR